MMIVLNFAEEKSLLNEEQLEDARASMRAMFLRTTGEETMLRNIIGILKISRTLNQTFNDMSHILSGISKSHNSLKNKQAELKKKLSSMNITVDENNDYVGSLLEFSNDFLRNVDAFDRQMIEYKEVMENQARTSHIFRLAQEARERLKNKFGKEAKESNEHDQKVRKKVLQSFNYADAESEYQYAKRSAKSTSKEVKDILKNIHRMCQMAMNPEMRTVEKIEDSGQQNYPDIYALTSTTINKHPRIKMLLPMIQNLLKMYQHSFGMFELDFRKFNQAIIPMTENTEDYFQAKDQDDDMRDKQEKLKDIEFLLAFIDAVSILLRDGRNYAYPAFSSAVTNIITMKKSKWSEITEILLRMKVDAEAELSTRIS